MDSTRTSSEITKRRKTESKVWDHFTRKQSTNGIDRAYCNYCPTSYACHTGKNGTSNLHRHLSKCAKLLASFDDKQKSIFYRKTEREEEGSTSTSSISLKIYNEERCRQRLAKMIVMDELPFNIVQSKWFAELVNELQSKFVVPSRKTLANDISKMYECEKGKLEVMFGEMTSNSSMSLTTDTRTSIQNVNYMVVTAHFIDVSWVLHKKIINFGVIADHKGETIATIIENCLSDWRINRVLTITVDNASANEVALNVLVKNMKEHNKFLVLNGKFMLVRCFAHILNLVVTSGLKEHNISIAKIRKAVKYVRSSPARMQKFKACIDSAKITCNNKVCLDIPTRWNSTYLMLQTAAKFEKAFNKLGECDISYISEFVQDSTLIAPPGEEDWHVVREFVTLLKVFYEVTLKVSSTLRITANEFFSELCKLNLVIKKYVVSDNTLLSSTTLNMQKKFEKYWGDYTKVNHFMYVAVLVDPRFKLKFVRHCLLKLHSPELTNEILMALDETMRCLYAEYKVQVPKPIDVEENCTNSVEDFEVHSTFKAEVNNDNEIGHSNEIDRYFATKLEDFTDEGQLLHWWKMHSSQYPTLSRIARDVLAIPISTVASESAFSCGGRVLDPFRSLLGPKTVESIVCLQSWIRDANRRPNIDDSLEEVFEFDTGY